MRQRAIVALCVVASACVPDGGEVGPPAEGADLEIPQDQFLQVGDVSLHYLDWGGEGSLLLFVPGVTATAQVWNAVAPHFTDDYRVIAVTRREHGVSGKSGFPFDLDTLADDLAGVIDAFSSEPAIIVGHSYAGLEMPRLYRRHPDKVRALVFVDALYDGRGVLGEGPALPGFEPGDSVYPSAAEAIDRYHQMVPDAPRDLVEPYVRSQLRETEEGTVVWQLPVPGTTFERFFGLYAGWSKADYDGIDVPVLAIRAKQEKYLTANLESRAYAADSIAAAGRWAREYDDLLKVTATEALQEAVPAAVVVVLDSTSHMIPHQRPEELVRLLESFFAAGVKR